MIRFSYQTHIHRDRPGWGSIVAACNYCSAANSEFCTSEPATRSIDREAVDGRLLEGLAGL